MKYILSTMLLLAVITGSAQSKFSIGINGGADKSFNKFYERYYEKYDSDLDYNFGLEGIMDIGQRLRTRLQLKYITFGYGQNYNNSVISDATLLNTEIKIHNLNINPRIDYKLFSFNKLNLYLSTGVNFEFTMSDEQESLRGDGDISTTNQIDNDYKNSLTGGIAGLVLKYNLSNRLGITVLPDYTFFFDNLYNEIDGNFQRINLNVGIEWKF